MPRVSPSCFYFTTIPMFVKRNAESASRFNRSLCSICTDRDAFQGQFRGRREPLTVRERSSRSGVALMI